MNKTIRAIGAGVLVGVWLALTFFAWFGPAQEQSEAERRKLAQMPELTLDSLLDKTFMDRFEDYSLDQFPLRDAFRSLKALFLYDGLQQTDNNGYFVTDGYIVKQTYPLSQPSVNHALNCFNQIYNKYLAESECDVYLSVIPDKGYFLAEENYPAMDYESLLQQLDENMAWAQYLDITDLVSLEDYYRTDTHWMQEKLLPVAQYLCNALGVQAPQASDFTEEKLDMPFYGVYYGHAAMSMDPETITLLHSDVLDACTVYDHETGKTIGIYNKDKLSGADPYEVYLSGTKALLTIENPNATTERELILFRDSFGSSLAPLLVQGYKTVTLVDIRYVNLSALDYFMTFEDQDVLFLYSTLILNESSTMKK